MQIRLFTFLLLLLCAPLSTLHASERYTLSPLSPVDRDFMGEQRQSLNELAQRYFGTTFKAEKAHDLALLQRLLDQRLVRNDDPMKLQAMGVILGDLLAQELRLHWIVYEDGLGRSRALQLDDSENFLFPMTMISRRAKAGLQVDVDAVYEKAADILRPHLPKRPWLD